MRYWLIFCLAILLSPVQAQTQLISPIPNGSVVHLSNGLMVGSYPPIVLVFGAGSVAATTGAKFLFPGYSSSTASTTAVSIPVPISCTAARLWVHQTGAGNGSSVVYSLRKNGVATVLSVSIASTASFGSDTSDVVQLAPGDLIDVQASKALALGTSPSDVIATIQLY